MKEKVLLDKPQLLADYDRYSAMLQQINEDRNSEIKRLNEAAEASQCIEATSVDELKSRTDLAEDDVELSKDDQEIVETMDIVQTIWYQEKRPLQGYNKTLQLFQGTSNKT